MDRKKQCISGIYLAGCFLVLSGCSHVSPSDISDIKSIEAQASEFSTAYVEGNIEGLVNLYTESGLVAPPGLGFLQGREQLTEYWDLPEGYIVTHHQTKSENIIVRGDLAYDWGFYQGSAGSQELSNSFSGKYLIVWERGADGAWRIAHDMWNDAPSEKE
jgi:ketosteroid isomerase-like protein